MAILCPRSQFSHAVSRRLKLPAINWLVEIKGIILPRFSLCRHGARAIPQMVLLYPGSSAPLSNIVQSTSLTFMLPLCPIPIPAPVAENWVQTMADKPIAVVSIASPPYNIRA